MHIFFIIWQVRLLILYILCMKSNIEQLHTRVLLSNNQSLLAQPIVCNNFIRCRWCFFSKERKEKTSAYVFEKKDTRSFIFLVFIPVAWIYALLISLNKWTTRRRRKKKRVKHISIVHERTRLYSKFIVLLFFSPSHFFFSSLFLYPHLMTDWPSKAFIIYTLSAYT